jgi:O-antigen/teichoic acid export membrane protein
VLQAVLLWADTVILGILRPPSVTGTYSVAARVVIGVSIGLPALNLALAPFFARQLGDRDRGPLGDLYGVAARWGAILTFVPLAVVFAYRREILGFLDPGLVPGSTVITILIFGFLFNAACGPVGNVLNMSALNRLVLVDSLITVGANVALNLILIPAWGMNGAALAWSLSLGLVNVLMVSQVHRRLGVAVLRGPQVRTSVGLLLVFAGQIVASTVLGPGPVAAIGVAGALVVVALTRQPEDHRVLGSVLARVRGPIGRSANDGE